MFDVGQSVSVLLADSSDSINARIVHASPAHLVLELHDNTFPPIDADATIYLETTSGSYQLLAKVSGHWQHSPRANVEFARMGKPVARELQLGAA